MLCGLCFPSDRPLVACCCVWAWGVTPEIYRSGSLFWFFPTSLFFSPFFLLFTVLFLHSNDCFLFYFISFPLHFSVFFLSFCQGEVNSCRIFFCEAHLAVLGWVWGLWSSGWNPNPIQDPPEDSIFGCLGSSWWLHICSLFIWVPYDFSNVVFGFPFDFNLPHTVNQRGGKHS